MNVHLDPTDSIHIAVLHRGAFWKVNVLAEDGAILPSHVLERQFEFIVNTSADPKSPYHAPSADSAEACLPALTGQDRSRWAEHRETHFSGVTFAIPNIIPYRTGTCFCGHLVFKFEDGDRIISLGLLFLFLSMFDFF